MAIAGCDFICKNDNCECKDKIIRLTSAWPMAESDDVINTTKDELAKKELIELKNKGRRFLCKTFNATSEAKQLLTKAYRLNFWDSEKSTIWMYDLELTSDDDHEKAILGFQLPDDLKNKNVLSFKEAIEKGIICPYCKTELKQYRWFTNEH